MSAVQLRQIEQVTTVALAKPVAWAAYCLLCMTRLVLRTVASFVLRLVGR
jgi:hypothetical protein